MTSAGEIIKVHQELLKNYMFNKNTTGTTFTPAKFNRTVSYTTADNITIPETTEEKISKNGIVFYPEFLEFIFFIEGVPKRLLLFLIYYYVNPKSNHFLFNKHVLNDFNRYCKIISGKDHPDKSVELGLRDLVSFNTIQNIKRGTYMLNPTIACSGSHDMRRNLINQYSVLLVTKQKDPVIDFYPRYKSSNIQISED